jgi:hypothetical protein
MALSVVDLLEAFIAEHGRIGGPFETPEMFFKALDRFLDDPRAREAVAEAWWDKGIHHAHRAHVVQAAEQSFEQIDRELTSSLNLHDLPHGISDEAQARQIIDGQLRNVELCTRDLNFQAFSQPVRSFIPAVVERAIAVIVPTLSMLSPELLANWTPRDYRRLHVIAGRLSIIGKPVPLEDLWEVRTHIFPRLQEALFSSPRRSTT